MLPKNTDSLPPYTPIGEPFVELGEVDSSNNYAMRQVQAHLAEHGITWFVRHQTAGKGQRGKSWQAEPGNNIIISTVVTPTPNLYGNQFLLSMMAALACRDFFASYAMDYTKIKWPNDLYWKDRKAGGILIENLLNGSTWKNAVIGIGININQTLFSQDLINPVSLKQITGKTYNVVDLAKELCACLERRWQQLQSDSANTLLEEYENNLYKRGEQVSFRKDSIVFSGVVEGVTETGKLLINTGSQGTHEFATVDWIMA